MLLEAEVETQLCTPQMVSKSGSVVGKRKRRRDKSEVKLLLGHEQNGY